MFRNNVFITCCKLSKSLLNPEKVQGSATKPLIKSGDFPSLPLMLHRSQPGSIHSHTTSPRRSASLHPPNLNSIVTNLVVVEDKTLDALVDAQGIGQGLEEMASRASIRWLMDDSWQNSKSQTSSVSATACTLTLKETPHVSCIRSPPGLEVIITNFGSTQIQPCDCLVHAKGISQGLKKNGVSIAFPDPFSWTQWRACGNPVFAYN